ncbi:MAG: NADH-quinone oxidoreductase subunit C [Nitrospirae bacterium]|nr:NADH-quinone oxidoreductase subunit C [Nitrospirota bacterium]
MKPEEIRDKLTASLGAAEYTPGPGDAAITVPVDRWHEAATVLRRDPDLDFDFLRSLSGVDRPAVGKIEVVCHLLSYRHRHTIVLKTGIDRSAPAVPTLSDVWPAANWHERELYDLFGVNVTSHPDLRRLLLPEDWVGHPLRKDYKEPDSYRGIPMQRPQTAAEAVTPPAAPEKP